MIKIFLPLIFILGLISCKSFTESADYMGQTCPDSIPVIFAPDIVSIKGRLEHGLSFSPDMREIAFGILNKDDFSGKIYYSKKVDDNWTEPIVFEPLKGESVFLPYFSPNGKFLVFTQSKWDTAFHYKDIWIIEKNNQTWNNPEKMKVPINSSASVSNACMALDGTVFFSSNINCIGIENCHTADLFYSELVANEYQSEKAISEFISTNDEESVFISPKQDYILFCRYTDNETWMDLYISYRDINNNWIVPQMIDSTINSKDWDRRPFVSNDNKFLFFTRLQIGEKGLTESDIFWVNTSKLFKPFVFNSLSDTIVQIGEKFEVSIPVDYFKDIDDNRLDMRLNQNEFDWLEFDTEKMKLAGLPKTEGDFELTFTAVDKFSNMTEDKMKITVKK
jgi:hypothetical protein